MAAGLRRIRAADVDRLLTSAVKPPPESIEPPVPRRDDEQPPVVTVLLLQSPPTGNLREPAGRPSPPSPPPPTPEPAEWRRLTDRTAPAAAPRALLTAIWAGFVITARFATTTSADSFAAGILAAAPLILAVWIAEWRLQGLRSELPSLRAGDDPAGSAQRARASLMSGLGWLVAVIASLEVAGLSAAAAVGALDVTQVTLSLAFGFLACSWFAASVLAAVGRADLAVTVSTGLLLATLGLITMARLEVVSADLTGPIAYLAGCLATSLALTLLAHQHVAAWAGHRRDGGALRRVA